MLGGNGTVGAEANLLLLDQVFSTYGVPAPTHGDRALVLFISNPLKVSTQPDSVFGYRSLEEVQTTVTSEGVYAVLGVSGSGCFVLSAAGWNDPSATNVSVRVDITNH